MSLVLLPAAFHHPAFVWEVKHDGFRGLAYVERGRCRLFSRAGHPFRQFDDLAALIARAVGKWRSAVLDGESRRTRGGWAGPVPSVAGPSRRGAANS